MVTEISISTVIDEKRDIAMRSEGESCPEISDPLYEPRRVSVASVVSYVPPAKATSAEISSSENSISSDSSQVTDIVGAPRLIPTCFASVRGEKEDSDVIESLKGERIYGDGISAQQPIRVMVNQTVNIDISSRKQQRNEDALEQSPVLKKLRVEDQSGPETYLPTTTQIDSTQTTRLLALPKDIMVLNPLHVLVRQQIEVFSATDADINQPAPGRKNRVTLHRVGLRCIHCKNLPARNRVKRAVCYPSSVGRVYNSVSDMKHDHFSSCSGFSDELRVKFLELKKSIKETRQKKGDAKVLGCSSSTAQYYHDSAICLGMVDVPGGILMAEDARKLMNLNGIDAGCVSFPYELPQQSTEDNGDHKIGRSISLNRQRKVQKDADGTKELRLHEDSLDHEQIDLLLKSGSCSLESPLDSKYLNPLHCFVRQQIELFVAMDKDISAPAPGRKTRVVLGQVGLRCRHCVHLPPKDRVKRSICYPASVSGIYHSVSNMKFDHFGKCKGLPEQERERFNALREASAQQGRRSAITGAPKKGPTSSSTAQYYLDSALRLGIQDTEGGIIRLSCIDQQKEKDRQSVYGSVPDGISALMIAANVRGGTL